MDGQGRLSLTPVEATLSALAIAALARVRNPVRLCPGGSSTCTAIGSGAAAQAGRRSLPNQPRQAGPRRGGPGDNASIRPLCRQASPGVSMAHRRSPCTRGYSLVWAARGPCSRRSDSPMLPGVYPNRPATVQTGWRPIERSRCPGRNGPG